MRLTARSALAIASVSIVFSLMAFLAYFVFTPVVAPAAILGAIGAAIATIAGARRAALVAGIFALVPLSQLFVERISNVELLVFVPAMLALAVATWVFVDYAAERRARAS